MVGWCHWQKYIINIHRDVTAPLNKFKIFKSFCKACCLIACLNPLYRLTACLECKGSSPHKCSYLVVWGNFFHCSPFTFFTTGYWLEVMLHLVRFFLKWHCDCAPKIPSCWHMPTLKYEGKTCYKTSFTHVTALLVWDWWVELG